MRFCFLVQRRLNNSDEKICRTSCQGNNKACHRETHISLSSWADFSNLLARSSNLSCLRSLLPSARFNSLSCIRLKHGRDKHCTFLTKINFNHIRPHFELERWKQLIYFNLTCCSSHLGQIRMSLHSEGRYNFKTRSSQNTKLSANSIMSI